MVIIKYSDGEKKNNLYVGEKGGAKRCQEMCAMITLIIP